MLVALGKNANIENYVMEFARARKEGNLVELDLLDFSAQQCDIDLPQHDSRPLMWRFLNEEIDDELGRIENFHRLAQGRKHRIIRLYQEIVHTFNKVKQENHQVQGHLIHICRGEQSSAGQTIGRKTFQTGWKIVDRGYEDKELTLIEKLGALCIRIDE